MKIIFLFLSAALASGLLLANIYSSVVDARSWGADLPHSIGVAREYFKAVDPGNFFRIFSPVNQVLGLLVLILYWKASPVIRTGLGVAFLCYVVAEGLTFAYFFPRNALMFRDANLSDVALLKRTWLEWSRMNWLRSSILLLGIAASFFSIHKIYTTGS
jgi:hypothetical protein